MVKFFAVLILICSEIYALSNTEILKNFGVDENITLANDDYLDIAEISQILQDKKIIDLKPQDKPKEIFLKFQSQNSPVLLKFAVDKILATLGYANQKLILFTNNAPYEMVKSIKLNFTPDPEKIFAEFNKNGINIENFAPFKDDGFFYELNLDETNLKIKIEQNLDDGSYFINISDFKEVNIESNGDGWYPNIAIYDKFLNKIYTKQQENKTKEIHVKFPQKSFYMRLSDFFAPKNVKEGLNIILK